MRIFFSVTMSNTYGNDGSNEISLECKTTSF